eukprot:TRINITY_DN7753_c0_g1_i2.p1 TRINITY_DN7753_c0_g1~~TRINITY_DN7753_c0_g1_i2.p1  ORF type:complete len:543 (-),score=169.72 TRINITY_DN7753_c0_g1_i2:429-2057(-)
MVQSRIIDKEEELQDLRNRYTLLEGDRKAYYETSQLTINRGRDIIEQLRAENAELKSRVTEMKVGLAPDQQGASGSIKEMRRMKEEQHLLRRQANTLTEQRETKEREAKLLRDELAIEKKTEAPPKTEETPHQRRIRDLENRLDKAVIKYNEAVSIRKTYESIVKRLREDKRTFNSQITEIKAAYAQKEKDCEELRLLSHDAVHANDVAAREKADTQRQLAAEKRERDSELANRRRLVEARAEVTQRLEKRQREEKARREQSFTSDSMDDDGLARRSHKGPVQRQKEETEEDKITTYEEAFRQIKEATGLSDVNEVIHKFLTQEDTARNLEMMRDEALRKIDQLNNERWKARQTVEEFKYSGTGVSGNRRVVDEGESHLQASARRLEMSSARFERIKKLHVNLKAGIEHLHEKLAFVKDVELAEDDESYKQGEEVALLKDAELKLASLIESIELGEEGIAPLPTDDNSNEMQQRMSSQEAAQQNNIRVSFGEGDDAGPDSADEDDDVEVLDRSELKKSAQVVIDKSRKPKRRKGRRRGGDDD